VTPLALTEFTSGFNIAINLSSFKWASMYGFSKDDLMRGINSIGGIPDKAKAEILNTWERDFGGFRFHPRASSGLFDPNQAMYSLQQVRKRIEEGNIYATTPEELVRQLLDFNPDPNTFPAESTLRIVSQHPLGRTTVRKAQREPVLALSSPVLSRFRLSAMNELSTSTDALLSFMFYMGTQQFLPIFYLCLDISRRFDIQQPGCTESDERDCEERIL